MSGSDFIVLAREAGLFALLIVATFTDVAYGKINNWLVYPAIVAGFGLAIAADLQHASPPYIEQSAFGFAAGLGLFGLFFFMGWMGPADVKLAAAIGALKGLEFFIWALVFITLAGCLLAVTVLIWQGKLIESLGNSVLFFFRPRKLMDKLKASGQKPVYIPYGLAMAAGTMAAWFLRMGIRPL